MSVAKPWADNWRQVFANHMGTHYGDGTLCGTSCSATVMIHYHERSWLLRAVSNERTDLIRRDKRIHLTCADNWRQIFINDMETQWGWRLRGNSCSATVMIHYHERSWLLRVVSLWNANRNDVEWFLLFEAEYLFELAVVKGTNRY